ncbi:PDZ domain-containing protein [Flavobacterium lindanitolerans]|nr:PDZ domain-containing protein [Flavobacterium lindanitolerans]
MSGIVVQHNGVEFVQEAIRLETKSNYGVKVDGGLDNFNDNNFRYKFSLKPVFEIASVRTGSPADLAGIQPGDKIVRINKKRPMAIQSRKSVICCSQKKGNGFI